MRRALVALALAMGLAATAHAAAIDPDRVAAIDQAADAFIAKAADAKKSGMVPRQSDPAIGALLDTVFDTRELGHGPLPYADLDRLKQWLGRVVEVGQIYIAASRSVHDAGLFGPEIGRYFDATTNLMQGIAACVVADTLAQPGPKPAAEQRKIDELRTAIVGNLNQLIAYRGPGLTVGWIQERLAALTNAAPTFAAFLKPAELARLRAMAIRMARAARRDKALRSALAGLAVALSEPAAPMATAGIVAANGEIALGYDGHEYSVDGRVNGASTVKFFVDSGASVVSLPKDLVEDLTKVGTLAASDLRGRNVYVTADGKRHRGTWLMLRQLNVGGHVATNVMASVAPAHATPLLGQSFLAKFKSWTLDNKRHVLVIAE